MDLETYYILLIFRLQNLFLAIKVLIKFEQRKIKKVPHTAFETIISDSYAE